MKPGANSQSGPSEPANRAKNVMKHTLRAVLVDDEELARGYLRELLATHPEIVVAAECANGFEAVKAIAETIPDLLFLDVQMPKLDGFEVLELIEPSQAPVVIFVPAPDIPGKNTIVHLTEDHPCLAAEFINPPAEPIL